MLTKLIMRGRFRPTDENPVNGVNVPLKVSGALNFVHLSHTHDLRVISLRRGAYPEGMGCKEARISRTGSADQRPAASTENGRLGAGSTWLPIAA